MATNREDVRVFVLGSFRDLHARRRASYRRLRRLVLSLRARGFDAFLSGDRRSRELASASLRPRQMTEVLEGVSDLAFYVASRDGRGDGWVSELTAMQLQRPDFAHRRLLLVQDRYPLSSILSPEQGGYLATPPVSIAVWTSERELILFAARHASLFRDYGSLPRRGRAGRGSARPRDRHR